MSTVADPMTRVLNRDLTFRVRVAVLGLGPQEGACIHKPQWPQ
jgi:hypothetical protein